MTSNAFIASLCAIAGCAFVVYFFFAPPPPTYSYLRTEKGEVTAIYDANTRYEDSEAKATVRLNSSGIVFVEVPNREVVKIGEIIEFDILESDREKLKYRLAQPTPTP